MRSRKRGRPRNSAIVRIAQADTTIAEACVTLTGWGYPIGDRVGRAIAEAAAKHLNRTDANGLPLGWHSIEKIHKKHVQRTRLRNGWTYSPGRWTKASRRTNCPKKTWTIEQWADYLIQNRGRYETPMHVLVDDDGQQYHYAPLDFVPPADPVLTPRALAQIYGRPAQARRGR